MPVHVPVEGVGGRRATSSEGRLRVDVELGALSCSGGPEDHSGGRGDDGEPDEVTGGDDAETEMVRGDPGHDHRHTQSEVANSEVDHDRHSFRSSP
jgi:hypothetical protein